MSSAHDIFIAYQQEIDAVHDKYRYDADNKEYDREKGRVQRKYALEHFRNGQLQEGMQLFTHAETNFRRSGDKDELAKTFLEHAKALQSYSRQDKEVLDAAQYFFQRAKEMNP